MPVRSQKKQMKPSVRKNRSLRNEPSAIYFFLTDTVRNDNVNQKNKNRPARNEAASQKKKRNRRNESVSPILKRTLKNVRNDSISHKSQSG